MKHEISVNYYTSHVCNSRSTHYKHDALVLDPAHVGLWQIFGRERERECVTLHHREVRLEPRMMLPEPWDLDYLQLELRCDHAMAMREENSLMIPHPLSGVPFLNLLEGW